MRLKRISFMARFSVKALLVFSAALGFFLFGSFGANANELSPNSETIVQLDSGEALDDQIPDETPYEVNVEQPTSQVNVEEPTSEVNVEEPTSDVNVEEPTPEWHFREKGSKTVYDLVVAQFEIHPEYDAGITPPFLGRLRLSTTKAGYDFYSSLFQEAVEQKLLVIDATFDMTPIVDERGWDAGQSLDGICTGGFSGHSGSLTGVITARHCVDSWANPNPATTYQGMAIQSTVTPTSRADIALAVLPNAASGLVRTGGNRFELMYFIQSPTLGLPACHFGIGSGFSCSTILEVWGQNTVNGENFTEVALLNSDVSSPADSGGPWFTTTRERNILGIHRGETTYLGRTRSVFTYIEAATLAKIYPDLAANSIYT
jgi:hypothetical protein